MGKLTDIAVAVGYAIYKTVKANVWELFGTLVLGPTESVLANELQALLPGLEVGSPWLTVRALNRIAPDGAWLSGPARTGSAKFAIRKGLPGVGQKTMAVENEPHAVDDFSGDIKSGYGMGTKTLLYSGYVPTKIEGEYVGLRKINIHRHRAARAGLHDDLVVEGVKPGVKQFEINTMQIPEADLKGRFAIFRPKGFKPGQVLITRMKEQDVVVPKPKMILKDEKWLASIDPAEYVVEWKPDGGLANAHIVENRAIFTSHRSQAPAYYDKLPALEWLNNHSRLLTSRILFPYPDLDGTVLQGELFHPDGASRVGGILNSGADKAIKYQIENGPVTYYVWDIVRYRGKDVSKLSYDQRRSICEQVVGEVRRFNRAWDVVPVLRCDNPVDAYDAVVGDSRGLPYAEGVVVKRRSSPAGETAYKLKARDTVDAEVLEVLEGTGKYKGTVGKFVIRTPGGAVGEVGSFKIPDSQRKWVWRNRDQMPGQVAEISAQGYGPSGTILKGVFVRWHPTKSDTALGMYEVT